MRSHAAASLWLMTLLGCAATRPNMVGLPSYRANADATVRVSGPLGSGVVVSGEGHVLTCRHVIERALAITVEVLDTTGASATYRAVVVGEDVANDLALLRVEDPSFHAIRPATLADPGMFATGDGLYGFGYPLGGRLDARAGTIVKIPFRVQIPEEGLDLRDGIRTLLRMDPGMSGGPVFSHGRSRLVGIHKMSLMTADGENLGSVIVSAKTIRAFLDTLHVPYHTSGR